MPLEQDVLDIEKRLKKLVEETNLSGEAASDLLSRLTELPITKEILQKTKIYMTVNVIRKKAKANVQTLAKELIKSWKNIFVYREKDNMPHQGSKSGSESETESESESESDASSSTKLAPSNGSLEESSMLSPLSCVTDPMRKRCQNMIANSLKCEQRLNFDPTSAGIEIELAIYEISGDIGAKYKNLIRSRVLNLRNRRNVQLRLAIIDGEISAEEFARMSAEELACDDLKEERKVITEQAIKDHQLLMDTGSRTGKFKCIKCGHNDTSYTDEPMTTFVCCNHCGNRWKGENLEYASPDLEEFVVI